MAKITWKKSFAVIEQHSLFISAASDETKPILGQRDAFDLQ